MNRILIGRAGEDLHEFVLDDIKRGAVRESGLFPELFEKSWPAHSAGVLVTGVERKLEEHRNALKYGEFDFPLWMPPSIITKALEDSKEEEHDNATIAKGKLYRGFVRPIRKAMERLGRREREDFAQSMAERARIPDIRHLLAIADDRKTVGSRDLLEPVYGNLRHHSNKQLLEIFEPGHDVPGERVKETDGARYGVVNALWNEQKIVKKLRKQGIHIDERTRMDTTLALEPVIPGVLPLPEQGLVIQVEGDLFHQRKVSKHDIKKLEQGRILTHDHFNMVGREQSPDLQEEISLYYLKKQFPMHPYLTEQFSPAAGSSAMAYALELPKVGHTETTRPIYFSPNRPNTVMSSTNLLTEPPDRKDVLSQIALPNGMGLSRQNGGLNSLSKLERLGYSGEAFIVMDPERFEAAGGDKLSKEEVKLLRDLETDLIYSYLITMSTQAGAPNHIGRSHMVDEQYFRRRGLWHPDFSNLALTGDTEMEAFRFFSNARELEAGLKEWDETTYQHALNPPANDFPDEQEMLQILGVKNLGYVLGGYGSATSFIDNAFRDPKALFYAMSRYDGLTTIDGGGVRSAMLGMKEGALKAISEGYKVHNIGVRSESDVSPLEGNIEEWIKGLGYTAKPGDDPRLMHFADEQMKVVRLSRLLQRQTPIAGLSHACAIFPGGKGSVVEIALTKLHNARTQLLGAGLFHGYSNNDKIKPIIFVDHEFETAGLRGKHIAAVKRHIFDKIVALDEAHNELLGIHVFNGDDRIEAAEDLILNHAKSLGFDLKRQSPLARRPANDSVCGKDLQGPDFAAIG